MLNNKLKLNTIAFDDFKNNVIYYIFCKNIIKYCIINRYLKLTVFFNKAYYHILIIYHDY